VICFHWTKIADIQYLSASLLFCLPELTLPLVFMLCTSHLRVLCQACVSVCSSLSSGFSSCLRLSLCVYLPAFSPCLNVCCRSPEPCLSLICCHSLSLSMHLSLSVHHSLCESVPLLVLLFIHSSLSLPAPPILQLPLAAPATQKKKIKKTFSPQHSHALFVSLSHFRPQFLHW
jgi:hypothetical protein